MDLFDPEFGQDHLEKQSGNFAVAGIIGMKAIQIEDQVVANWLSKEIHEQRIGCACFLLNRAIERLDAPDCDSRPGIAAEARTLGEVGQIGNHDGFGD